MPSSYSSSLRFELQFTGENVNIWGDKLNAALSRADEAIAGWATIPLTGPYSLTSANGLSDQARLAMLKFSGTGAFAVTVPAVSKRYDVWNACSGVLTLTNGSASVTLQPGEVVAVVTDGAGALKRVQPTDFGGARITGVGAPSASTDACTKGYADALAFASVSGNLPGQSGAAGRFLYTDGTMPSWIYAVRFGAGMAAVTGDTVAVNAASPAEILAGSSTDKPVAAGHLYSALAEVTLALSFGHVTPDMSTFINGYIAAATSFTLDNPTNIKAGQSGRIRVRNTSGASNLSAVGSFWKRQGGLPPLTQMMNADDYLVYDVVSSNVIIYDIIRNPS